MQNDHRHTVFFLVPILISVKRQSMQLLASPAGVGLYFEYQGMSNTAYDVKSESQH